MTAKKPVSRLTRGAGNLLIFSSPKVSGPLPVVTGPVAVAFKHESSISGVAIGPVVVTAKEPYAAWLKEHGVPHTGTDGQIRYLCPFGAKPEGRYDLGWATQPVAQEVAAHYGVPLEEV